MERNCCVGYEQVWWARCQQWVQCRTALRSGCALSWRRMGQPTKDSLFSANVRRDIYFLPPVVRVRTLRIRLSANPTWVRELSRSLA